MTSRLNGSQIDFLARNGFGKRCNITLLKGGKNNVVYRMTDKRRSALLKVYFKHRGDSRDRGGTEFSFSTFAWASGLTALPRPIDYDPYAGAALYSFEDGRSLAADEISESHVHQAITFFAELNRFKSSASARALPNASEACFSIAEHIACIDGRVNRLVKASGSIPWEPARLLIEARLMPRWNIVKTALKDSCRELGLAYDEPLKPEERRLSPSDFGFHNALLRPSGDLVFLDFEYAGWDDVAKTICDFFLQPALPVPIDQFESFSRGIMSDFYSCSKHERRAIALFPAFRIKWTCILLNDFLAIGRERRNFSLGLDDEEKRRNRQLEKAMSYLKRAENAENLSSMGPR